MKFEAEGKGDVLGPWAIPKLPEPFDQAAFARWLDSVEHSAKMAAHAGTASQNVEAIVAELRNLRAGNEYAWFCAGYLLRSWEALLKRRELLDARIAASPLKQMLRHLKPKHFHECMKALQANVGGEIGGVNIGRLGDDITLDGKVVSDSGIREALSRLRSDGEL